MSGITTLLLKQSAAGGSDIVNARPFGCSADAWKILERQPWYELVHAHEYTSDSNGSEEYKRLKKGKRKEQIGKDIQGRRPGFRHVPRVWVRGVKLSVSWRDSR